MSTAKLIDDIAAGNLENAAISLRDGVSPNTVSKDGATAMHIAAGVGMEATRLMLLYGGDPNVRSVDGSTPLHVAAAWGDRETLRLLLHNGANPNLVDQDGQRPVDIARSEGHAACADLVKYFTMLVTIGDEDENPLYTAEPVSTLEDVPVCSYPQAFSPNYSEFYSDEEEPANLSLEYSDALSRRLSQLLSAGKSACLDVTSPSCPFVDCKEDHESGAGDRTVLVGDTYSETSSKNPLGFEECSHCFSSDSHYCVKKASQNSWHSSSEKSSKCLDPHCSETAKSPECFSPETCYAIELERKMKKKYFPDLSCQAGLSNTHGACSPRERSLECVRTAKGHSYFQPHFSHHDCSFEEAKGRIISPSKYLSRHHSDQTSCGMSSCYDNLHCTSSKPEYQKLPSSPQHHPRSLKQQHDNLHCTSSKPEHQKLPSSPQHHPRSLKQQHDNLHCTSSKPEYQKLPSSLHHHPRSLKQQHDSHRGRELLPESCTHSEYCSHVTYHSGAGRRSFSPVLNHSLLSHNKSQPCCGEHNSSFNKSPRKQTAHLVVSSSSTKQTTGIPLSSDSQRKNTCLQLSNSSPPKQARHMPGTNSSPRKQTAHPPISKPSDSRSPSRSPVTVLYALNGSSTPPPDMLKRFMFRSPSFTTGASVKTLLYTDFHEDSKKAVSVAGSHCGVSVDSGYCEKILSELPQEAESIKKLSKSCTKPTKATQIKLQANGHIYTEKPCHSISERLGKHLRVGSYEHFSSPFYSGSRPDEADTPNLNACTIGTVLSRNQADITGSDRAKQTAAADVSGSSVDSFCTCTEASEPETYSDSIKKASTEPLSPKTEAETAGKSNTQELSSAQEWWKPEQELVRNVNGRQMVKSSQKESFGFIASELALENVTSTADLPNVKSDLVSSSQKIHSSNHDEKDAQNEGFESSPMVSKSQRSLAVSTSSLHKLWVLPSEPLPDTSLMTSDESFMVRQNQEKYGNPINTVQSSFVSDWLKNQTETYQRSKLRDNQIHKTPKRISDESTFSSASSYQEYIYRDKANGITLIERHIPSVGSAASQDTEETVSYDWSDFVIDESLNSSSSLTSFDITEGRTLNDDQSKESYIVEEDLLDTFGEFLLNDKESTRCSQGKLESHSNTNPVKSTTTSGAASQQLVGIKVANLPVTPEQIDIPPELTSLSNEAIYQSLKDLGEDRGPVLPSTRQTYLQQLASLQSGKYRFVLSKSQPGYSSELNGLLSKSLDMEALASGELTMVAQFQTPDGRTWREGTIKSCFNYLLLDPRITKNLPLRSKTLSDTEAFKTFLSAVFYIGKGKRSRPYCHLYEAISHLKAPKRKVSQKVQRILDIWSSGVGVVSLHCFQNVIPVEAYTREACMVDAIGLGSLTNVKRGDYYGVASTWPVTRRCSMGAFLLQKAFHIFLSEGERQICPLDIQKGK